MAEEPSQHHGCFSEPNVEKLSKGILSQSVEIFSRHDRKLGGVELQFTRKDEKLLDTTTKSEWNIATGKAINGSMKGKQLKPIPGVVSYRRAWANFHPETKYWSAK